jgi:hypothetical protein
VHKEFFVLVKPSFSSGMIGLVTRQLGWPLILLFSPSSLTWLTGQSGAERQGREVGRGRQEGRAGQKDRREVEAGKNQEGREGDKDRRSGGGGGRRRAEGERRQGRAYLPSRRPSRTLADWTST